MKHNLTLTGDNDTINVEAAVHATQELYRKGTSSYLQKLHDFTAQIDTLKSEMAEILSDLEEEKKRLQTIETEIEVQMRMLDRINRDIHSKIDTLISLKSVLKKENPEAFEKLLDKETYTINALCDEAETMEIRLLETELNRLNIVEKITPLQEEFKKAERQLKKLEADKKAFEHLSIHDLPQLALAQTDRKTESLDQSVVDTEIEKREEQ